MSTPGFAAEDDEELAHRLADAARAAILPHFRDPAAAVDDKAGPGGFDPVTAADRGAEAAMRAILDAERPDDGVLGEEFPEKPSASGRVWVLDPVDGTGGFVAGLVNWGVLIGLNVDGRAMFGVLDQPYIGERFVGRLGPAPAAYLERDGARRALRTRRGVGLDRAVFITTSPDLFAPGNETAAFRRVADAAQLVRYGTDCYGYAMVALGAADVVVEAGLRPFDIQALIPIIEAAGGVVTDWAGGRAENGGRIVAAGTPALHAETLEMLRV